LDAEKDNGFLHIYNNLLYKIANKGLRESVRDLILLRMEGKISNKVFDSKVTSQLPSRGKARDVVQQMLDLVNGAEGEKLRPAIAEAIKQKADTSLSENIAERYKVQGYDVRYFMAVIRKAKTSGKSNNIHSKK
jgi:hypothetical protein